ncbi:MAG: TlpA family protein disulfide reductase [Gammaproteobacteria bacterium]
MKSIFNNFLIIFLLFSCSKPYLNVFEGKGVFLDDLKGKWIVFNYWADWCPPCIKEIPELNNLQSNFSDDLKVFLINFDMLEGEELKQQLEKFNVQVDSLLTDPSIIYDWVIPENLPVTFIVNRKGELELTLVGPQTEEEIIKLLSL